MCLRSTMLIHLVLVTIAKIEQISGTCYDRNAKSSLFGFCIRKPAIFDTLDGDRPYFFHGYVGANYHLLSGRVL